MHKAAVLADIHSNYQAFRACINDAKQRGAECFILLGDYVSDLADPQKCLDLVYELQSRYSCHLVRGNREGYMLAFREGKTEFLPGSKSGSLLYTYRNLREKDLVFLGNLPIYQVIDLWGVSVEIAHATAERDRQYFDDEDGNIGAVFDRMRTEYFLTAHSHRQYAQSRDGKTIINPGSVGVPMKSGSMAQYAILEVENDQINCRMIQVMYDIQETIKRQFESGLTDCAGYWAVSVLYDLITGENWTMALLERVGALSGNDPDGFYDETIWKNACGELGIPTTQEQLLVRCCDIDTGSDSMDKATAVLCDRLTGELIGLARATDGNEHLINPAATAVVTEGLRATREGCSAEPAALEALLKRVEEEKRKMIPDCFLCACPCGKNNAFDMAELGNAPEEIRRRKKRLLSGIRELAGRNGTNDGKTEAFFYKALIVVGMEGYGVKELDAVLLEMDALL